MKYCKCTFCASGGGGVKLQGNWKMTDGQQFRSATSTPSQKINHLGFSNINDIAMWHLVTDTEKQVLQGWHERLWSSDKSKSKLQFFWRKQNMKSYYLRTLLVVMWCLMYTGCAGLLASATGGWQTPLLLLLLSSESIEGVRNLFNWLKYGSWYYFTTLVCQSWL